MNSDYSLEMVLASIIYKISDYPDGVCLTQESEQLGVNLHSLRRRFREVKDLIYHSEIYYDDKDHRWKAEEPRFLESMSLTPEEAVLLAAIRRSGGRYDLELKKWLHRIINRYVRRRHTKLVQKDAIEKTDDRMLDIFATIKHAIRKRRYLKFFYKGKETLALPLQIVNLEYYWYFLAEKRDESWEGIILFTVALIQDIEIIDEYFDRDKRNQLLHKTRGIEHGMNAFYKPHSGIENLVEVLVPKWYKTYLERAPFYGLWNIKTTMIIDDEEYYIYTIVSTSPDYMDIIPTIQKNMPHMIVRNIPENQDLINLMREKSEKYAKIFRSSSEEGES